MLESIKKCCRKWIRMMSSAPKDRPDAAHTSLLVEIRRHAKLNRLNILATAGFIVKTAPYSWLQPSVPLRS